MTQNIVFVLQVESVNMFKLDTIRIFDRDVLNIDHKQHNEFVKEHIKTGYSYASAHFVELGGNEVLRNVCIVTGEVKDEYYG